MSSSEVPDADEVKVFVSDEGGPDEYAGSFEDDGALLTG